MLLLLEFVALILLRQEAKSFAKMTRVVLFFVVTMSNSQTYAVITVGFAMKMTTISLIIDLAHIYGCSRSTKIAWWLQPQDY